MTPIEPLERTHDLYERGFRYVCRFETQSVYFRTIERARTRAPMIEENVRRGFFDANGVLPSALNPEVYCGRAGKSIRPEAAAAIKVALENGVDVELIAKEMGCSVRMVKRIQNGRLWRHVRGTSANDANGGEE